MGFLVEPFKHDLFVSYSHGAFKGQLDSDLKLWSQKFAEELRAELLARLNSKRSPYFWTRATAPTKASIGQPICPSISKARVQDAALLTILMTQHYLRSEWCRKEREWWCAKHHPDTLGAGNRIFVCRVRPTGQSRGRPNCLRRWATTCYDQNKEPDKARPFTWRGYTRDRDDYIDLLVELSGDVMQRLRAIRTALEERRKHDAAAARLAFRRSQVIYLHARETHAEAWHHAGNVLIDKGFVVLPPEPDPIAREPKAIREIAERRVAIMSGCDGLLLLGTEDGRALDADLVVVGRQDRNAARAITDRPLPCGVLDTAGAVIGTARRRAMARALRIDWIDAGRDLWPGELKGWLIGASAAMERAQWPSKPEGHFMPPSRWSCRPLPIRVCARSRSTSGRSFSGGRRWPTRSSAA